MKLINTSTMYSYILTETEWYAATEQQREAWINQIMREAAEFRCLYVTILVEPEPLLSISPLPKRHKVWGHTFPTSREEDFKAGLNELLYAADIPGSRLAVILRAYADEWAKRA